ncbi:protein phosphatase 2C domain-containing protein [Streptomyces antibioticus]|uniref:protein phosphatase 2C domain-containing protein n=1 Tax=Streptomyces antibioticus TaxID=1890 RepID=UPI002251C8CA|nr:protein phosphatase 2C domain-containing protein [Streptomyces antibioticus]MCX4741997.1 protein phosphatase 2C domain-containing protein [Streptomyces antibioticus]
MAHRVVTGVLRVLRALAPLLAAAPRDGAVPPVRSRRRLRGAFRRLPLIGAGWRRARRQARGGGTGPGAYPALVSSSDASGTDGVPAVADRPTEQAAADAPAPRATIDGEPAPDDTSASARHPGVQKDGPAQEDSPPDQAPDAPRPESVEPRHETADSHPADPEPLWAGRPPRGVAVLLPPVVSHDRAAIAVDGGAVGGVTVRMATVRGRGHMQSGEGRQDAFAFHTDDELPWLVAVVADGVSTAMHAAAASSEAAASAGRLVIDKLRSGPPDGPLWWQDVCERTAEEITRRTESLPPDEAAGRRWRMFAPGPPATTLAVLIASRTPAEDPRLFGAVVGDSRVLRLRDGAWSALLDARPTGGRGAGDERVQTLPQRPHALRTVATEWQPGEVLVLATDGFADAIGARSPLTLALGARWQHPPSLLGFLRDVDFRKATYNDDRTVVALWPENADTAVP